MLTPYSDQVIFTLMNSKDSYVNFYVLWTLCRYLLIYVIAIAYYNSEWWHLIFTRNAFSWSLSFCNTVITNSHANKGLLLLLLGIQLSFC